VHNQLTGRLQKTQLAKIPNQGVKADFSEAVYPFGQVLCTYVVNLVSAWVPSIFDRIRYCLEQDDNNKKQYDQKHVNLTAGSKNPRQQRFQITKNNKIAGRTQDVLKIPSGFPVFLIFACLYQSYG
jgi:hypothetical protein